MFCAIDIGTNTVRLLVAEPQPGLEFTRHLHRQQITRLGGNTTCEGLALERMEQTTAAIKNFVEVARTFPLLQIRSVATAAVRSAANSTTFTNMVEKQAGLKVDVLTGDEEAILTTLGVFSVLEQQPGAVLVFDLGGGSLEVCLCEGRKSLWQSSYPVGVVQLAEQPEKCLVHKVLKNIFDDLHRDGWLDLATSPDCQLVGTAGTVTTLASMHLKMSIYQQGRVNNLSLSISDLIALQTLLRPLDVAGREALPGMEPGRGDLVPHGLELITALMQGLSKEKLNVSDAGLLEGLVLDMMTPCKPVDT